MSAVKFDYILVETELESGDPGASRKIYLKDGDGSNFIGARRFLYDYQEKTASLTYSSTTEAIDPEELLTYLTNITHQDIDGLIVPQVDYNGIDYTHSAASMMQDPESKNTYVLTKVYSGDKTFKFYNLDGVMTNDLTLESRIPYDDLEHAILVLINNSNDNITISSTLYDSYVKNPSVNFLAHDMLESDRPLSTEYLSEFDLIESRPKYVETGNSRDEALLVNSHLLGTLNNNISFDSSESEEDIQIVLGDNLIINGRTITYE